MRARSALYGLLSITFAAVACAQTHKAQPSQPLTHPLLPGIRSSELSNEDWPRVYHDKQLTAFSPLTLGMTKAPATWTTMEVGGEVNWVKQVRTREGRALLLINDGRIRAVTPEGEALWTGAQSGGFNYFGDLRGNGRDYLVLSSGRTLTVLEAATGKLDWQKAFEPTYVAVRPAVGDILPEKPGLEMAVWEQYGEEGCLLNFPPEGEPEVLWRKTVVVVGEHPERYDHGCDIKLDLSEPARPVIWNIRHHRCFGVDARTGEIISHLVYNIGTGHLRNYGPWALGRDREGRPLICVTGEVIQQHVEALRLSRKGPSELAWQHYYGEVYRTPGVAVKSLAMDDVDGDGSTEMVYNVRDPAQGLRSFVRVRDAGTGDIEAELADAWCSGYFSMVGSRQVNGLLIHPAPHGATPEQGPLTVHVFTGPGTLTAVGSLPDARRWGPVSVPGTASEDLLLLTTDRRGKRSLASYTIELTPGPRGKLVERSSTGVPALTREPLKALVSQPGKPTSYLATDSAGALISLDWQGRTRWQLPLVGGAAPQITAADINGDGRAEIFAACGNAILRVISIDAGGQCRQLWQRQYHALKDRAGPLLYDVAGSGKLCVIAPGTTADGQLCARVYQGDGALLWETVLPGATTDNDGTTVSCNAGDFLPGPRPAVAISICNGDRTQEGTYLLEGRTGKIMWHKTVYEDGTVSRAYRPIGIPTAYDFDGDGVEDIGMDMYSYMAFLKGADGSFVFIKHTPNIKPEGALASGMLYNSYVPVYEKPTDSKPFWFVPLGFGRQGLMKPDPTQGVWNETDEYDTPTKMGLIDCDGDGVLEVGYSVQRSGIFTCRNLWTGEIKWQLKLPATAGGPVLVADVDGDGKGEFLMANYCIGTDATGKGLLRWVGKTYMDGLIADVDGDGKGEIVVAWRGKVYVLKAEAPQ